MIYVRLKGGLGNQMFQYAAGRRLALKHGVELVLDDSFLTNTPRRTTRRSFALGDYSCTWRVPNKSEQKALNRLSHPLWGSLFGKLSFDGIRRIRESPTGFNDRVLSAGDDIFLDGYWQSELYFQDVAPTIREDFSPRKNLLLDDGRLISEMASLSSTSLHVRRGDYVHDAKTNARHGTCSVRYYQDALRYLADNVAAPRVFVFSDEPDWVKENLQFEFPATFVSTGSDTSPAREIYLMSLCTHHIIANSSFSWWGAWLGNREGLTIRPQHWFTSGDDGSSICPANWVCLPN